MAPHRLLEDIASESLPIPEPEPQSYFERHRRLVNYLTLLLVGSHLTVALLLLINRVTPEVGLIQSTRFATLYQQVDDSYWVTVNLTLAAVLGWGMRLSKARVHVEMWASSASFASWFVWGAMLLGWAIGTRPPVSLVGPLLTLMVVLPLSGVTAYAWSERDD